MAKAAAKKVQNLFRVRVFSPFETFFDDEALSLSAENGTGPFDILAGHANFLTLLTPCTVRIRTQSGVTELPVVRGVLHMHEEKATVFLNI